MKFRKKPVVIEAIQFKEGMDDSELKDFITCKFGTNEGSVFIETLEGIMQGNDGDWIIRGVSGEFYPCKPDIFKQTYDLVKE